MRETLNRRLTFVAAILAVLGFLIVYRLVSIQFEINSAYFTAAALNEYRRKVTVHPPRGEIHDRSGVLMATNAVEYEIGMSPVLIYDRQDTAEKLAAVIARPVDELLARMSSPSPYELLVRPAPATMGQAVIALNLDGVSVTPINRRFYPHGSLAAHVLGFVGYDDIGYYGVEGFYNDDLSGKVQVSDESRIPFQASGGQGLKPGANLYLTLDSEIQFLSETTLAQAMSDYGATSGTIIVMNPKTGEILAMASAPTFDPNRFFAIDQAVFSNPAISQQYEPGSTSKVLTMGIALDTGTVQPDSTYDDTGQIEVGGIPIHNWDRQAHGVTTMTDLLAHSLNVGAAKLSIAIGPTKFYHGLDVFGMGKLTGIDLQGEAVGLMRKPGQTDWHEADLAENSFGQALAATPLQMLVSVGSVANDGLMMQPHVVARKVENPGNKVTDFGPTVLGRTVSQQTARTLSEMLADGLRRETPLALVPGYSIAGKTGTAEIPIPGGYDPDKTIASFIGWGPLDNPRFVVLVKLDRPTTSPYGSETAAPAFAKLVRRLVVLMEIPPDSIRAQVTGGG